MNNWSVRIDWTANPTDEQLASVAECIAPNAGAVHSDERTGRVSIQVSITAATLLQAIDQAISVGRDAAAAAGGSGRFAPTRLEVVDEPTFLEEQRHPRLPELIGFAEIAEMAGVSRQRARQYAEREDFPPAVAEPSTGPLRIRDQVETWFENWRVTRTGGRPRASKPSDQ